jgi:NAD-dependent dihydropyrimidine dehydrogenase PreA subunit
MAVERYDLDACIGCRNCINICPMDVFRFDEEQGKSIIAYPEHCQGCGMCYYNCMGKSLQISLQQHAFPVTPMNATCGVDMNHFVYAAPDLQHVRDRLAKEGDYATESTHSVEPEVSADGETIAASSAADAGKE